MPQTLAGLIKAKYPGVYDDVPDAELEAKVITKYPGVYDDLPRTQTAAKGDSLPEMMANVPTDEAGQPLGQPSALRQSLESMAYPQTAGEMASLTIPGGTEVAQAMKSGVRSAPTLIGAAAGYAHGGIPGAIEGAMGGGIVGAVGRAIKGGMQAGREALKMPPSRAVLEAIKEQGTTIAAKDFGPAITRVAKGEDAATVVKELSGKVPATTAERRAAMGIVKRAPVIAAEDLPAVAVPPAALPAPATPVPVPATTASGGLSGYIPKSWEPLAEPGALEPAQPAGKTMSGAPQASRPFVPPAQSTRSPASAVNQAMKDLGLRFPAQFMDAAIKRVRAGEAAEDVVRSYAAPIATSAAAPSVAAANEPLSATEWTRQMVKLREIKPRPIDKLYGANGPTAAQQAAWDAAMKDWNRKYRYASAQQKAALATQGAR